MSVFIDIMMALFTLNKRSGIDKLRCEKLGVKITEGKP